MAALIQTIPSPIRLFDLREFGVEHGFIENLKIPFTELPADDYLHKQNMFECIENRHNEIDNADRHIFSDFYNYKITESDFFSYIKTKFSESTLAAIVKIKPSRFRYISSFIVKKETNNKITSIRNAENNFKQVEAKSVNDFDWRLMPRYFTELPDVFVTSELHYLIHSVAEIIFKAYPRFKSLKLSVHHTKVISTTLQPASNSPEGIHQDGMDLIMSALVLIKENAAGGTSYIYGADSKTPIFESMLQVGQGIIQPDKNTQLWHSVDKIIPIDPSKPAIRATIGFDFEFMG